MITILCSGSRGDIQPYIALAQELIKLGKDTRIATGKSFEEFVTGYGIGFYPLSADYKSVDIDPKLIKDAQNSDNPLKMLLTFNQMKKYASYMTEEMFNACTGSDLIVHHPGCTIGYFTAQNLGIPSVMASPFPMNKTSEVASVIAYGRFGLPVKFTYTLLQSMLWTASKTGVIGFWKEKFGKLPDDFSCPFEKVDEKHPAVVSCSNYVFKRPGDWNEHIHQYGYWFVEENDDYAPPAELQRFLENGKKPIYFGFGSVFRDEEKDKFVRLITEALQKTRKRGILCGMGDLKSLPENIFAVENIPHTWLFDQVSAVCHHGGAGTSAAGFRAGVPSIIVPFSNDQFAWGHRAFDIGVGSKPITKSKLTVSSLTDAIEFVSTEKVQNAARELGKNIASENGAADCAKIIARCLK